jgi:outer membrane lipoprotein-sorting protein
MLDTDSKEECMRRHLLFICTLVLMATAGFASDRAASPNLPPDQIIVRMERRFLKQIHDIESYQDQRRYSISHRLLGNSTYWLVEENYSAPGDKRFEVLQRGGSAMVQKRVFARLLEVEQETAREAVRSQVDLSRNNYDFTYLGFDESAAAYKFQAAPRGANAYLLRGTIWVNAEDFAVQRIEGEPATRHSMLIKRVHFVHEFARFGEFWFPVHHHSETELRLFGSATLDIDYSGYQWQSRQQGGL